MNNLLILGDSYSTFSDHIPEGYACYYGNGKFESDVTKVEETWWHQFVSATDAKLQLNCSYCGSTICNTGYEGVDCSDTSFIGRFEQLIKTNYFNEHDINTVIVFGGTNDTWANSPLGELEYKDWNKEKLYCALPAFCYLLNLIKTTLPNVNIVVVLNDELKSEILKGYQLASKYYNVHCIKLNNIEKIKGHPTVKGMMQINDILLKYIMENKQ